MQLRELLGIDLPILQAKRDVMKAGHWPHGIHVVHDECALKVKVTRQADRRRIDADRDLGSYSSDSSLSSWASSRATSSTSSSSDARTSNASLRLNK